jgi:hypothetical protein
MTQEIQYSPVQFNNITPVLDVGDPSASFIESVRFSTASMKDQFRVDMNQYAANQKVEQANLKRSMDEMKKLSEFSEKAAEKYTEYKNVKMKERLSDIWAENFNAPVNIDEDQLAADYSADEQDQAETAQVVGEGLAQNLTEKDEPTVQDIADAGRIRRYSGLEGVVAANARSAAAMESYGPALASFLGKVQPEPGESLQKTVTEFNKRWADATGLSGANPGFTAKHVYPTLRREAAAEEDSYTRGWNAAESANTRDLLQQGLADGTVTLTSYFEQSKGLVKGDGKTLMNNDDIWNSLNGRFTPAQLTTMGAENFAVTGKPYSSHPRFNRLMTEARAAQNQKYNLGRAEQNQTVTATFNALGPEATREQMEKVRGDLILQGIPLDIVDGGFSSALRSSTEATLVRQETNRIRKWVDANPGKDIPPEVMGNAPYQVRQTFSGLMSDAAEAETTSELIRDSQAFKDFSKDFKAQIQTIGGIELKLGNPMLGETGPANFNQFKSEALTDIVLRSRSLMMADPNLSQGQAFQKAKEDWIKDTTARSKAKELYDRKTNTFKMQGAGIEGVSDYNTEKKRIQATPLNKLTDTLHESDYNKPVTQTGYSDRVKLLGAQYGLPPKEIVDRARAQAGLPKLENSPADDTLGAVDKPTMAKVASVENPPAQLALRAQITSGQNLTGTAQQRTVAVGQQLLAMGYGGIWQHPDFNYDSGYTGTGKETHYRQGSNSAHNHSEALDIGLAANSPQKLEMLYQYLLKNKERFGVRELFYAPKGSGRPDPDGSHWNHVHVSFNHRPQG